MPAILCWVSFVLQHFYPKVELDILQSFDKFVVTLWALSDELDFLTDPVPSKPWKKCKN